MTGAVFIDASPLMQSLLTPGRLAMAPGLRVHYGDPAPDAVAGVIGDAEAVLNGHTFMPAALLESLPRLRRIVFLGAGAASYIDLTAAERLGIDVRVVRGYGDITVAEHTLGLILAAARQIGAQDADLRGGRWSPREGIQLAGRTAGVIGLGGVGKAMVHLLSAIGMDVLCWSRNPPADPLPGRHVALPALLATADVITLHLALTAETEGFLGADAFAAMKPGAIFANTARAALVDEAALIAALQRGALAHAALDVFLDEPVPADAAILSAPNTTLTPHCAYKTREASVRLLELGLSALSS